MITARWSALALAAGLASACVGATASSNSTIDLTDSEFGSWTLDAVFFAGGADAAGRLAFGQIVAVAVDDTGRTYVADWMAKQITVLDPSGAVEQTLGRPGEGPGEFASISWVDLQSNGDLWVMDPLQRRLTRFSQADGDAETVRFPMRGYSTSIPWAADIRPEGPLVVRDTRLSSGSATTVVTRYRLASDDLVVIDSLALPEITRPEAVRYSSGGVTMSAAPPYAPVLEVEWMEAGLWRVSSDHFRVERLEPDGTVAFTLVADIGAAPVPLEVRDSLAAQHGVPLERIPAHVPPILSLDLDRWDNLWVGLTDDGETLHEWEVFDPAGHHLASVRPPDATPVLPGMTDWSRKYMSTVVVGEFGAHRVITFRLPAPLRDPPSDSARSTL